MTGLNKIIPLSLREGPWNERDRILKVIEAWENEEVRTDRGWTAYFCPVCTRVEFITYGRVKRHGVPKCIVHQIDMVRLSYEEERFRRKRKELVNMLRKRLDAILELFERAAEAYITVPELRQMKWRLDYGGELVVKPGCDPTEFSYAPAADAIEAFLYRYSRDVDKILEEGARRLGLKYYVETMPNQDVPPGFVFSRAKMLYVKEVDARS